MTGEGPALGGPALGSPELGGPAPEGASSRAVRVSIVPGAQAAPDPVVVDGGPDAHTDAHTVDGDAATTTLERLDDERALLRDGGGVTHRVLLLPVEAGASRLQPGVERREVVIDGWRFEVDVEPAARAGLRDRARRGREAAGSSGPTKVHAIIPGVVVAVSVAAGDAVTAGQQLLVVEAMKMQNELRAPRDGTIEQVAVGAGATIEVGDLLLVIA